MFEAIHGSAPRMVKEGIAEYANPSSILKASEMMLRHIGMAKKADILSDRLQFAQNSLNMTGDGTGDTAEKFADCVISGM